MGNKSSANEGKVEDNESQSRTEDTPVHFKPLQLESNPQDFKKEILGYLLPKSQIIDGLSLVGFNHVEELLPVYDWENAPKYIFVSHLYVDGIDPDGLCNLDDNFNTKLKILQLVLKQMKQVEYLWIDFSCIPNDESSRLTAFRNIHGIIMKALRVIILPLAVTKPDLPPIHDLERYAFRAWCALEYSIILSRHPSKIRIATIIEDIRGISYKLQLHSIPTHDMELGVQHLVSGMFMIRDLLEEDNREAFMNSFHATIHSDVELVWNLLKKEKDKIFESGRMRRNSDFFVRTKFASTRYQSMLELYDEETVNNMGTVAPVSFCGIPVCW